MIIVVLLIFLPSKPPVGAVVKEPLEKISLGDNFIPASAPIAVAYYNDYFICI